MEGSHCAFSCGLGPVSGWGIPLVGLATSLSGAGKGLSEGNSLWLAAVGEYWQEILYCLMRDPMGRSRRLGKV
jgi:hypothetical protein